MATTLVGAESGRSVDARNRHPLGSFQWHFIDRHDFEFSTSIRIIGLLLHREPGRRRPHNRIKFDRLGDEWFSPIQPRCSKSPALRILDHRSGFVLHNSRHVDGEADRDSVPVPGRALDVQKEDRAVLCRRVDRGDHLRGLH